MSDEQTPVEEVETSEPEVQEGVETPVEVETTEE